MKFVAVLILMLCFVSKLSAGKWTNDKSEGPDSKVFLFRRTKMESLTMTVATTVSVIEEEKLALICIAVDQMEMQFRDALLQQTFTKIENDSEYCKFE